MKTTDLELLIKKHGYLKCKRKPWMDAMPDSIFFIKGETKLEFNSKSRFIKRLNDFAELNYQYSDLGKIEKLLKGEKIE